MKKSVITCLLFLIVILGSAQNYCNTAAFDTTDVFQDFEIDSFSTSYGGNYTWQGQYQSLNFFIAHPRNTIDTFLMRPLILLIHGGSFHHGSRNDMVSEAVYFARKGYVSASIDYRVGWNTGGSSNPANCLGDNTSHKLAIYRTVQDTRAAIRFIVANAAIFKVDTSQIFLGGTSAGAFAAMDVCYMSESDFEAVSPGITSLLGGLDTASNDIEISFSVKGVLAYKDAIFDSVYISPQEMVPTHFLHGTADPYYPFLTGPVYTCPGYFTTQGAGLIAPYMERNGGCFEHNYKINGDHGEIYPASYTLARRSHFVKRILCGECHQTIVENQVVIHDSILALGINENSFIEDCYYIATDPYGHDITVVSDCNDNDQKLVFEVFNLLGQLIFSSGINRTKEVFRLDEALHGLLICKISKGSQALKTVKIILH